jgi:myo-inositol-1(or 4)-monophosphatase
MSSHLETAVRAAREAGSLLRKNFGKQLEVNQMEAHDIKLAMDVQAQELIESIVLQAHPECAIYGEEGISGDPNAECKWVIDPIDGTVNYYYGIPHFCISIALQRAGKTICGVVHDPMREELWTVSEDQPAQLNGKPIKTSTRKTLPEAIVVVGFSKTTTTINAGLPLLERMVKRARKCRMLGSAALDLAYIASGRLDAYIEQGVSLWDIAAGWMLIESAGGKLQVTPRTDMPGKLSVIATNGVLDLELEQES